MAPSRMSRLMDVVWRGIEDFRDIAHTPNGFDAQRGLPQPSPNTRNVELERVGIDGVLIAKQLIHEPLPRHHLSGMRYQQFQQTKFAPRQFNSFTSDGNRLPGDVDGQ